MFEVDFNYFSLEVRAETLRWVEQQKKLTDPRHVPRLYQPLNK